MKILLISNMFPSKEYPTYGVFVKNFEKKLQEKNIVFDKVVIKGRGKNKIEKLKKYFNFFIDIYKTVKKNDYDLIYVHYINHSLVPFLFMQKKIKKPLILNAHGSDVFVNNKIGELIQKIVTPIIIKADLIVVPSKYFLEVIEDKFNIKAEKIFVSPSGGIDTKHFFPISTKKDQKPFTIGYVSRIDPGKGWNILLEALKQLKEKKMNFRVLLVGDGSQRGLLIKEIQQSGLNDNIVYIGAKPHSELVEYFNQMDIFVFPTQLPESLGLVGLEAMACGVPVIGSIIGGLPSYIEDGINGKLVPSGNVKKLADTIESFINMDKAILQKYQNNAYKTAQRYDSKVVAKNLLTKLKHIKSGFNEQR